MNFMVLREVETLRLEVRELKNRKMTASSLTRSAEAIIAPMASVKEYEEFVVKLQDQEFKNDLVRFFKMRNLRKE